MSVKTTQVHYNEDHMGLLINNWQLQTLTSDPSTTYARIYYNSTTNKIRLYNIDTEAWEDMESGGAGLDSEAVQDVVGAMLTAGNNIDLTYDDVGGTLTIDVESLTSADITDFNTVVDERARDAVGTALTAGNNIDITVNDAGDTITIDVESLTSADVTDFAEAVSDTVGAMVAGNTETGITVTYDDADNTLDFVLSDEYIQDVAGAMVTGGTESGITVSYDDTNARFDFTVTDSPLLGGQNSAYHLSRTNHTGTQTASTISDFAEAVSDQVGTMVTGNTETGIAVTYDDADNTLDFALDNEYLQDTIGAMVTGGTESGITVSYDDTNARFDFTVTDSPLLGGQNSAYHLSRANHTGTQAPSTITFAATDRLLGRDTASGGAGEEISVGGGLEFTGSGGIQRSALTGDITASAGSNTTAIAAGVIVNADVNASAAIAYSKLNLANSIVNADIASGAAIAATKLAFTPAQNIAATNVQAAIEEVVTDLTAAITATSEGKSWKDPVRAASTTNLTLSGTQTIDGIAVVAGERVLAKDQSTAANNGIYVVAAGAWSRAADMSTADEADNATVLVEAGTVNGGDVYTQTADIVTIGTTAMTWVKSSEGNTVYSADGTTLTLTGSTFSISNGGVGATQLAAAVAGNGLTGGAGSALAVNTGTASASLLEISSDVVRIAADAAGNGLTGGGGSALAVGAGNGITVNANDVALASSTAGAGLTYTTGVLAVGQGTGISVAADAVAIDTAVVARKYSTTIGDGTTEDIVVTHNLGTRDILSLTCILAASPYAVQDVYWEATTTNTVTVFFPTAPASGEYRVNIAA